MVAPTGEQYEIVGGGYRAVVTECGATLRLLEHEGRPLLDGFAEDEKPGFGRGQLLMPWPNRMCLVRWLAAASTTSGAEEWAYSSRKLCSTSKM